MKRTGSLITSFVSKIHSKRMELLWSGLAEVLRLYFRVQLVGLENLPREGPFILIPNHSGYAGADAIVLAHVIHRELGRAPLILAHRFFFDRFPVLGLIARSFGLRRAEMSEGVGALKRGRILILFPEAEVGNFKSSHKRYRLQPYHGGFARMALEAGCPAVPCLVIGAEESHLCLGSVRFDRMLPGLRVPLPLNWFPLPAKWTIHFHEPVALDKSSGGSSSRAQAERLRVKMQAALKEDLAQRHSIYF